MAKKGQAAFEFLSTYGWAFLIIVAIIAIFFYYFDSNPSDQMSNTCTIDGMPCEAFNLKYQEDLGNEWLQAQFQFQNPVTNQINLTNISFENSRGNLSINESECIIPSGFPSSEYTISSGELIDIDCILNATGLGITPDDKNKIKFVIEYEPEGEVFSKYMHGEIIDYAEDVS